MYVDPTLFDSLITDMTDVVDSSGKLVIKSFLKTILTNELNGTTKPVILPVIKELLQLPQIFSQSTDRIIESIRVALLQDFNMCKTLSKKIQE